MADAPGSGGLAARDALYAQAASEFGSALQRLGRAYEADPDRRQDLLQDIHIALWRSFATFDGRCSIRTWVYRVAHNVATSQIIRRRAHSPTLVSLDEVASMPDGHDGERLVNRQRALERLLALIQTLKPADRQVILLYLEGFVPGLLFLFTGRAAADPDGASRVALSAIVGVLMFLGIGWLNERAARGLDREIEMRDQAS